MTAKEYLQLVKADVNRFRHHEDDDDWGGGGPAIRASWPDSYYNWQPEYCTGVGSKKN